MKVNYQMEDEVELSVVGEKDEQDKQDDNPRKVEQKMEETQTIDKVDHEIVPEDNTILGKELVTEPENIDFKYATLELTHRNPLTVLYDPTHGDKVHPEKELPTEYWLKIIDKLEAMGIEEVLLTGGEPLIREDFHTILQYAINSFGKYNVVVKTNGLSKKKLSDFDCEVQIPVEYVEDPRLNNEVRRLTDPNKFEYDLRRGKLVNTDIHKCEFCGKKTKQDEDQKSGGQVHLRKMHQEEIFEDVNEQRKEEGKEPLKQNKWNYIKNSNEFSYSNYLEQEQHDILEKEFALREALNRAKDIENPVTLRVMVYNNNDLDYAIQAAQTLDCDTVFVPLRPLGRDTRLREQVPNPGRMKDVIQKIYQYDYDLQNSHRVENPLYKVFKYKKDKLTGDLDEDYKQRAHNWFKKGKVTQTGRNKFNIRPDGVITPSRYIRHKSLTLGNILEHGITYIREQTAKFNDNTMVSESLKPITGFDVRQRSIGEEPDIILNDAYPIQQEVN